MFVGEIEKVCGKRRRCVGDGTGRGLTRALRRKEVAGRQPEVAAAKTRPARHAHVTIVQDPQPWLRVQRQVSAGVDGHIFHERTQTQQLF